MKIDKEVRKEGEEALSFAEKHGFAIQTDGFNTYIYDKLGKKLYSDPLMFCPVRLLETMKMVVTLREREAEQWRIKV